ncbi:MAG: hypothetical protein ONB51_11745 [candidate division KSB1 bacterium]|nr:hypothetical protein [candidate division KSB1 bacterium]
MHAGLPLLGRNGVFTKRRQLFHSKSGKTFFECRAALIWKFARLPKAARLLSDENGLSRNGFFRGISAFVGGLFVFDPDTHGCITLVLAECCMPFCCCPEEMACVKCSPTGCNSAFACKIFHAPPIGWLGVAVKWALLAEGSIWIRSGKNRRHGSFAEI